MGDPQQQDDQAPEVTRWRYVGGVERVYPHVPVTVQDGAVIEHDGPPADDGCWEAAGESEVTHRPDNQAPDVEPAAEPAAEPDDEQDDSEQEQFRLDEHVGE